jgi:hypothetical protein
MAMVVEILKIDESTTLTVPPLSFCGFDFGQGKREGVGNLTLGI